ncbi:Gamma-glutamyl cyclotransferase, AIG2-like [Devosia enhydra]|uniref:Putative gamma-glutamylcyclotransferase n=1 Tax=Devosia enhydra TaxID=665118 RepID=A0A1K2I0T7_9HYPH|nr:gamma-glutamylcyclotransferase family protein [Devosia enhydra]SFZ85396.1 Gamma-glutamyl cyclotransferase, AIG2-like [Devosia enhydra]
MATLNAQRDEPARLFVYGTLRDPELLMRLLGRPVPHTALLPAAAPGWRAVALARHPWPVLARSPGHAAEGLLVLGLTAFERDLLDAWEGEGYRRLPLPVMVEAELFEADAYLPVSPPSLSAPDWDFARWQLNHRAAALVSAGAEAETLRLRLIALRPH